VRLLRRDARAEHVDDRDPAAGDVGEDRHGRRRQYRRPPTLYLLHGLSDDDTIWSRRTSIERYVAPLGLAVVMPQVHRSYYADEVQGNRYWTFLSEEQHAVVDRLFRLSRRREDTFAAGLSMGGYGALNGRCATRTGFAAAASLSGVLDLVRRHADSDSLRRIFGPGPIADTGNDLLALLDPATAPPLYICCGTADPLYTDNVTFATHAGRRGSRYPPTSARVHTTGRARTTRSRTSLHGFHWATRPQNGNDHRASNAAARNHRVIGSQSTRPAILDLCRTAVE
jgi:hypothetical protein